MAIFPNLSLWRRRLCSNLGGIDPEKLYRATLNKVIYILKLWLTIKDFLKRSVLHTGTEKLSIAAQLPMVLSFRWKQTCELVINVKNNVVKKIRR